MEEKILFKCIVGSYLYGTNSENSDIDIKGVFLPKLNDLILGKAPKHYTFSTGNSNNKNTKDDVDETYYSLHYFLELAAKGDTNAIDLLFAYTNKSSVKYIDPIFQKIIDNIDKILTKNVQSYLGYCLGQAKKYSIKGDKLRNFKGFEKFLDYYSDFKEDSKPLTLGKALNWLLNDWVLSYENPTDYIIRNKKVGKRYKQNIPNFGDHCYVLEMDNKEWYLMISDVKFQFNETVKDTKRKLKEVIDSYGKRSEAASNDKGVDWKAISHCIRVLYQVEELLTTNKITFPLVNAEFVKSIKYNTSNMTYEEIMKLIEDKISLIDNRLLPNSTLREKADYKWIEQFILDCYKGEKQ